MSWVFGYLFYFGPGDYVAACVYACIEVNVTYRWTFEQEQEEEDGEGKQMNAKEKNMNEIKFQMEESGRTGKPNNL